MRHDGARDMEFVLLLLRREQRSPLLFTALAVVPLASAALGWHLAQRGLAGIAQLPDPEVLGASTYLLASLGRALVVPFAFITLYLLADRIARDHEDGWLAPLTSTGIAHGLYPVAVLAGVLIVVVPLSSFATICYTVGVHAGDGLALRAAVAPALAALPGQAALLVAAGAYGTGCAILVRRRGASLVLAVAGLALPVVLLAGAERLTGSRPPRWAARVVSLHIPRPTIANTRRAFAEHAGYTFAVLLLLSAGAPRLVARRR